MSLQAGTGKTYVAKAIQSALQGDGKSVSLTTSTGIAGKQYNFRSRTLHTYVHFTINFSHIGRTNAENETPSYLHVHI